MSDLHDDVVHLAELVVDGDARLAIATCGADTTLAAEVSRAAASLLIELAASRWGDVSPRPPVWPAAQHAFVALARVRGAEARRLAEALLECCLLESVPGSSDQLDAAGLRLILDHCTPRLRELFRQDHDPPVPDGLVPPWNSFQDLDSRFVVDALWTLPGPEGVQWMRRLLIREPYSLVSSRPLTWTPRDWVLRLDAISEMADVPWQAYAVTGVILNEDDPPPIEASVALTRWACARLGDDVQLRFVRRAAAIVAGYRSGDPSTDAGLFWWDAETPQQCETLRWLLELCGPAGTRETLVAAARSAGRIDSATATMFAAAVKRPLWADGDVPWVFSEVVELGSLTLAQGVLEGGAVTSAGTFASEWRLEVEPGDHRLRAIVAVHPVRGSANAAVELVIEPAAVPERWERVSCPGATAAALGLLGSSPAGAAPAVDQPGPSEAGWVGAERVTACFAMPAAADGRALWVGRNGSRVTRVVLDLDALELDLAADRPPWFRDHRVPEPEVREQRGFEGAVDRAELRELARRGASLTLQRLALREALRQRGVSEYSSAVVMSRVHDGIALMHADADVRSRLGGAGRLPPGASWPTTEDGEWHLAFLAGLALSELPHLEPLPANGTLLIYQETETWGGEHNPLFATRVIHVPEGLELETVAEPDRVLFPLPPKPLAGMAMPIPGESELVVEALELVADRQLVIDSMNDLMDEWPAKHWLLGASRDVQGPARLGLPHALGELSGEQRARFTDAELGGEGWLLLAQINEDDAAGIEIGDGGSFYLFIPEDDLRQLLFDRVVGLMQCH